MRYLFYKITAAILLIEVLLYFYWPVGLWNLIIIGPLILIGFADIFSREHTIRRNYPIIGNFRYLLEGVRPEIMQYFVETNTEGRPLNRLFRSLVYQRAKNVTDTTPFGTQMDVYRAGYEWLSHSMFPIPFEKMDMNPRINIGGKDCHKPYSASLLNISAMSFGSLSKNAVLALNQGAAEGGFYHNTGEGAISRYHLQHGADLVWQIGTGYFGCRDPEGNFNEDKFKENASRESVKMIEIKLSQGAKPGHGGILPAAKNNKEIAEIRGVKAHTTVYSPPFHLAFSTPKELCFFIKKLRELSGGKPVGFKICIGRKEEFLELCEAMIQTEILPDFITVDGGEGGTGAAPVEFSNSLGMPLRDGLSYVNETLMDLNLRDQIKIIASGKIISGFHMVRVMALGADLCNTARGMMLSLGCIQALKCNTNECPTGVTTQNKMLMRGLIPKDKARRVRNYHDRTLHAFVELLAAAGLRNPSELQRKHILRRINMNQVMTYEDLYPTTN